MNYPLLEGTGMDVRRLAEHRSFAAGEQLTLSAGIGLVEKGKIRVTREETGQFLTLILPGGVCGASTVCARGGCPRTRLTATEDTAVFFLSESTLLYLLTENRVFLQNYLAFLSRRICFLNDRVGTLSSPSAENKLLTYLLSLGGSVTVRSMKELASSLAMGRASLYRALDTLAANGVLRREENTLTLL